MNDDEPKYLSNTTWAELPDSLNSDNALRLKLGVKLCPFTGRVEEYTVVDRLGGDLDIWPEKWRGAIEAGRQEEIA